MGNLFSINSITPLRLYMKKSTGRRKLTTHHFSIRLDKSIQSFLRLSILFITCCIILNHADHTDRPSESNSLYISFIDKVFCLILAIFSFILL